MASMTRCGTCVPPGPSRNAAGCPLMVWESEGNWERTQARSRAEGAKVSVVGMIQFSFITDRASGEHDVITPRTRRLMGAGDPSLRLKNGFVQDDAVANNHGATALTKSASMPYAVAYRPGFSSMMARPGK